MIQIKEIEKSSTAKLEQVLASLLSMLKNRQQAKQYQTKKHKKLKLNLDISENGHYNVLLNAVQSELNKRKLSNG